MPLGANAIGYASASIRLLSDALGSWFGRLVSIRFWSSRPARRLS